jgi:hypothetical protein
MEREDGLGHVDVGGGMDSEGRWGVLTRRFFLATVIGRG